jgi:hypothetical protein
MEPIKKLFQSSFFLEINKRKKYRELLQKEIFAFIPEELISLVNIKNQIGKILIVEVESNVVAHKLKLYENKIIDAINQKSGQDKLLNKIKVRMIIQNTKIKKYLRVQPNYSVKKLQNLSDSIKDSPLKTALKILIKTRND